MSMNRPWRTAHPDYAEHVVQGVTGSGLPPMGALLPEILDGRKTTHRLLAVNPDVEPLHRGRSYAIVERPGQRSVCKVRVNDLALERIRDMSEAELAAEGFRTLDDWLNFMTFTTLRLTSRDELDTSLHVWVAQFELDVREMPLMLARQSQYGYTDKPSLAMRDEMPVLDDVNENTRRRWQKLQGEEGRKEIVTRPALTPISIETELHKLVRGRSGDPEDVAASIQFRFPDVTPGEIRKVRREMGLRAIDGLDQFTEEETERMVDAMFAGGQVPSVRDLARVLDSSTTKANLVIHDRTRRAA